MGSWNESDFIMQLPILPGNKVRAFVIVYQKYNNGSKGGGYCSINDIWYPRGLPIKGEYADYGEVDSIIMDASATILLNGLKKDFVPFVAKDKWEKSVSTKKLNLTELISLISRDNAFVFDGESPGKAKLRTEFYKAKKPISDLKAILQTKIPEDRSKRELGMALMLEDVYQALIKWDPIEARHTDRGYLYMPLSELLNLDMEEWYNTGLINAKKYSKADMRDTQFLFTENVPHWNTFNSWNVDPPFCKGLSYYYDFLRESILDGKSLKNKEVKNVTNGLIEYHKVMHAMHAARKSFIPQCGKGSQASDTDIYKILANTTLKICAKQDAEQAKWSDPSDIDYRIKHNEEILKKWKEEDAEKSKQISTKKAG